MSKPKECGVFWVNEGQNPTSRSFSADCISCPLNVGFSINNRIYGPNVLAQRKRQIEEIYCQKNRSTPKSSTS